MGRPVELIEVKPVSYREDRVILTIKPMNNRLSHYQCERIKYYQSDWKVGEKRKIYTTSFYRKNMSGYAIFIKEISNALGSFAARGTDFELKRRLFYDQEETDKL